MKQFLTEALGWGFLIWLFGYVLGIVLFMMVPPQLLGWVIMPLGIIFTIWVLGKKIKTNNYFGLAVFWTAIAIICDYLFLVKIINPADGYYKLDVYMYYGLTFLMPIIKGIIFRRQRRG